LTDWRLASGFFYDADEEPRAYRPGTDNSAQAYRLSDGRWMLAERYRLDNGLSVGLWIDITELKQAEKALRDLADRLVLREAELSSTHMQLEKANSNLEHRVKARTDELLAAQDKLVTKERMAAVGQLTATVAHELRNPISAIRNTVHALQEAPLNSDPLVERQLNRISRSVHRCNTIIEELLDYSRSRPLRSEAVLFDPWLEEIFPEIGIPADINVTIETAAQDAPVAIDTERMRRVVINLVENAVQALTQQTTGAKAARPPRVLLRTRATGEQLEFDIEDNGPGISRENIGKVFEPLFTTKPQGTGLGLPTVKQIIEQHAGNISVQSIVGKYTRATVRLPRQRTGIATA
jgi:signal transduction histidine kinase